MRPSLKNRLINFGLLSATIILFFAVGEIGLRVTGLSTTVPNPPKIFQKNPDPRIRYELRPSVRERAYRSTVTTNGLGFRSPEMDPKKPTIAFLGDSITFGYGVEDTETVTATIARMFPAYNILNTGVPGYDLGAETATYETKIAKLKPSALVLIFYPNDLTDSVGILGDDGVIHAPDWNGEPSVCDAVARGILGLVPGKCWLDQHSAFYRAVKRVVNQRQGLADLAATQERSQQNPLEETVPEEKFTAYARELERLVGLLPEGLPRLFVIWPDREMHAVLRPRLRALAETQGFAVLDLYDTFGNTMETLGWDTVHVSADATEEAGTVIGQAMRRHGLVR